MNLTVHVIKWNALTPPSDLTVSTGGIVIGAFSNGSGASSYTHAVTDNSAVTVSVTQTGYKPYTMVIDNVYSVNKTIYIMMVPDIVSISDPLYNRPNPYFFYLQDPTSFKVDYYSATSLGGDISWYINNALYNTGSKGSFQLCATGKYQLKMRSVTYNQAGVMWDRQWANTDNGTYLIQGNLLGVGETGNTVVSVIADIATYLALDIATNITEAEYRPDFSVEVSSPTNQLETDCCYTKDEEVTITPTIVLNGLVDNVDNWTITYVVTNPDGTDLPLSQSVFPLNITSQDIVFTLAQLGVYTVFMTLDDTYSGNTYTKSISVNTCNFVVFDYVDCNTFTISNKSSDTSITYQGFGIDGNVLGDAYVLAAGHTSTIVMTSISIFTINVTYDSTTEIYILNNYCAIEDCISTFILDILCHDTRPCEGCPDSVELNQMLLLSQSYFMKVNSEYGINNFYSGLDDSKLAELTDIQQTMDKLIAFCSRRGCISNSFASATHDTTFIVHDTSCGCGCSGSGWVTPPAHPSGCQTCNGMVQ